jgi:hypothetical protein
MSTIRPEVTGRSPGAAAAESMLPSLTALDLERHISVKQAAEIKGVSQDTFKRHYPHLIRKVSPRRNTVKLRDLLSEETASISEVLCARARSRSD